MAKKLIVNNLTVYEQGEGEKTLVWIHGYGANGKDLLSLSQPGYRCLFPEGPISLDQFYIDAHAWFEIELETLSFNESQFEQSAKQLLDAFLALQLDFSQTILAGFSQGAVMALEVAFLVDLPFRALGLFSTMPINVTAARASGRKIPFFQSHGRHDSLLSLDPAVQLFRTLEAASWPGQFYEFAGEHEIPVAALKAFQEFISDT